MSSASEPLAGRRTKGNSFSHCSSAVRVRGSLQDYEGNGNCRARAQEATVEKGSEGVSVSSYENQVHRAPGEAWAVGSCFFREFRGEGLR